MSGYKENKEEGRGAKKKLPGAKAPHAELHAAGNGLQSEAGEKLISMGPMTDDISVVDISGPQQEHQAHQIELEMQLKRVQAELEEARAKYTALYDYAPVAYFTLDSKGLILAANHTAAVQFGIERASLTKKPFPCFVVKDDQDAFFLYRDKVLEKKTKQTCEIRLKKDDGTEFIAQLESIAVDDSDGYNHINTTLKDITEHKESKQLLRESEETLKEQKTALEQKNIAFREMIEHINIEKNKLKEDIAINIENNLMPVLSKIKFPGDSLKYMELLKHHLEELASSFGRKITDKNHKLTPKEIEICTMIKGGLTSKEMCKLMGISNLTVEKHRRNIRKKLGLSNKNINLASFLHSL